MFVRGILTLVMAIAAGQLFAQQQPPVTRVAPRGQSATGGGQLATITERASYSFGMMIGSNLKKQGAEVDLNLFVQGLRDAISGGKLLLSEQEAGEAMAAFEQAMVAKKAKESQDFLAQNSKRPGVQTTRSGLQYKVVKPGNGPKPGANDAVEVIYRGMFVNGDEFDGSSGKPFTIGIGDVITGWQEALQSMPVGSKWLLFIPPDLAYGEEGRAPIIGPNMALVFELELVSIAKAPPAGTSKAAPRAEQIQ